jgi:hypothetical protein
MVLLRRPFPRLRSLGRGPYHTSTARLTTKPTPKRNPRESRHRRHRAVNDIHLTETGKAAARVLRPQPLSRTRQAWRQGLRIQPGIGPALPPTFINAWTDLSALSLLGPSDTWASRLTVHLVAV